MLSQDHLRIMRLIEAAGEAAGNALTQQHLGMKNAAVAWAGEAMKGARGALAAFDESGLLLPEPVKLKAPPTLDDARRENEILRAHKREMVAAIERVLDAGMVEGFAETVLRQAIHTEPTPA